MEASRLTKADAIRMFGTASGLQKALGLKSHASVSMWGEYVPRVHALAIRHELRPDAFDADGQLRPDVFGPSEGEGDSTPTTHNSDS